MTTILPEVPVSLQPRELILHRNETVQLSGCVYKIRKMSGFAFVLLQMREEILQCVWSETFSGFSLETLQCGMSVEAEGIVVAEPRSHSGYEVRLQKIRVLSTPEAEPPLVIHNREVNVSLEIMLDYRPLTLRNERQRAIFKIQAAICAGLRSFFSENGFIEIHTPKLCAGTAEGGANVFRLDYFGKEAFLATSPQLYKQIMVGALERVYEIGPVFRAEKHDTSRHINEYTSVDVEMGFLRDFQQLMQLEIAMLAHVFQSLRQTCPAELKLCGAQLPACEKIPVIPFAEAKQLVSETFHRAITDTEDFEPEEERLLCQIMAEQTGSEFVFVSHYRSSKRPFYAKDTPSNPQITESFDLLFRGLEITTGGQRIHDYAQQVKKMRERGMDPAAFESYLMAHRYGLPPHGGFGLGLERLTARLLNLENIRSATLFPRDINRLTP